MKRLRAVFKCRVASKGDLLAASCCISIARTLSASNVWSGGGSGRLFVLFVRQEGQVHVKK